MNSVERVKAICKERKIPISQLEKDLNFANGYIGQLRKGAFPDNRLIAIANYLSVSPEYLATGEEQKETPTPDGEGEVLEGTYFRLAKGAQELGLDDEDVDMILNIYRKHKERNK